MPEYDLFTINFPLKDVGGKWTCPCGHQFSVSSAGPIPNEGDFFVQLTFSMDNLCLLFVQVPEELMLD